MKSAICFDYFGFVLFFKNGFSVVQCPITPVFYRNVFLNRFFFFYKSSFFLQSLLNNNNAIVNNVKHFSFLFRNIRQFIFPFRRFCFVKFELWGLGLRFYSCIWSSSNFIMQNLVKKYPSFNNESYFKLLLRYWRFRIGLSHQLCFYEINNLKFILRQDLSDFRRRLFLAISMQLPVLYFYCTILRFSKSINVYKYRGLKYSSESIKLKIGKAVRL